MFEIDNISDAVPKSTPNQLDTELVLVSDDDKESLRTVLPRGEKSTSVTSDFLPVKGEDEADLFLEQRRDGDSSRNSLVTTLLRTLEYYNWVLFLTTNRPGHIDDSFISRITCPIAFQSLSSETKTKIINKFTRKFSETGTVEIDMAATKFLLDNCRKLNERQIRDILQSAVALAEVQRGSELRSAAQTGPVTVKRHHVKSTLSRQTEFMSYLDSLKGGRDEPTRAKTRQDSLSVS